MSQIEADVINLFLEAVKLDTDLPDPLAEELRGLLSEAKAPAAAAFRTAISNALKAETNVED